MVPNWLVYIFLFALAIIAVVVTYVTGKGWEKKGK
jgi:hypothetical protein